MEENKIRKKTIDELCKNLKFENDNHTTIINNGNDLLNYINKINEKSNNLEKQVNNYKIIIEKEEKNIKKFIPLFELNNNLFYETISTTIKNTIEPPEEIDINNNYYNNVFILNKILEKDSELCFEIKLGHGFWNNFNKINNKDINHYKYNKMNSLKVGLLKLNEENIKDMGSYLTISSTKEIVSRCNWNFPSKDSNQKNYEELCLKYKKYKENILYSIDLTHLLVSIKKKINNKEEIKRFIQKNDIVGIVINNKKNRDYIEIKIFINGLFIISEIIYKEYQVDDFLDIDDDYKIEQKGQKNNDIVPFIELGINKSIFIKDKENLNKDKEFIVSNEKMKFFIKYNCLPLNYFPNKTYEIQKLTEYYLDILMKVGTKIFNYYPNEINKYFKQLINFFDKYIFENKTILKNKILDFLSSGINLDNGDVSIFKENIKILFYIIGKCERKIDEKIKLVKLIVDLLIELIIENNFELIDDYNLNEDNKNEENQLNYLRKIKFTLFFLIFDNYVKEEKNIKTLFIQENIFKEEKDFINFYFAMFNCCFFNDSINALDFLKLFYNHENKFQKQKFLEYNFYKSIIINNQNNINILSNDIIKDYKFIIQNIENNLNIAKKKETSFFFKFLINFTRSEDNISIINGIIIQLIKNYFRNKTGDLDKSKIDKILYINYCDYSANTFINKENEDTFFGKNDLSEKNKKFPLISKNIKDIQTKEIKEALFFDLIINCISNYYQYFLLKEENAKNIIEAVDDKRNDFMIGNNYELNKISYMIEFYQTIFSGKLYINLFEYGNYLMELINLSMSNNYLDILPYKRYLNNILFILDYFKLRCDFIDKNNLVIEGEPKKISSILKNIFKYTTKFLGSLFSKIKKHKFTSHKKYEELISMNINILNKILHFDVGAIKHSLPEVKDDLILLFKNILELYDNEEFKSLYNNTNSLIEFLYYFNENKEHAQTEIKKIFFKDIMAKEIEEFSKMKNETEQKKNSFIEKTMYFSIFIIIYKRMKIIRDSLKETFEKKSLFNQELLYVKKYIFKFTQIMNILFNFLKENNLDIFYDTRCTPFLKVNSFICKTFKILCKEEIFVKLSLIYSDDYKLIYDFFTQFFFLLSKLLLSREDQFDYNYKIAKNRKGFHFEEFKNNFEKYFKSSDYKMMQDFLDILLNSFKKLCEDNDTLKETDVDDNSIEIDQRDICPICYDDFTTEKEVHLNDCNHPYHLECLKKQISNNFTKCSLCKRPITGIKEDPNFKVKSNNNSIKDRFSLFGGNFFDNIFLSNDRTSLFRSPQNVSQDRDRELFRASDNNRSIFSNNINNNSSGGLFGGENNGSIFSNNINNNPSGGLFGSENNGSIFSNNINNNPSGGLFGNPNSSGGLFSNYNNNINDNPFRRSSPNSVNTIISNNNNTGLFGNRNNSSNTGLFGNNTNSNRGLFDFNGNNNQRGGLFG